MELARTCTGPDPLTGLRWCGGERTGIVSDLASISRHDIGQSNRLKEELALAARQKFGLGEGYLTNEDLHNKCIIVLPWNRNGLARVC